MQSQHIALCQVRCRVLLTTSCSMRLAQSIQHHCPVNSIANQCQAGHIMLLALQHHGTRCKWLSWCCSTVQPHCTTGLELTRTSCTDSTLVTWTRRNKLPRSGSRGGRAIGDGRRPDTAAQSCLSVCYIFLPLFELLLTLLLCLDLSFRRGQQRHPNMCRFQGSNVICAISAHQSCPSRRSECPQHKFLLIWRYSSEHLQSISLEAQQMYQ